MFYYFKPIERPTAIYTSRVKLGVLDVLTYKTSKTLLLQSYGLKLVLVQF